MRFLPSKTSKGMIMKVRVHVMLKDGVLDPQGEAVRHALGALGFDGVEGVRQGKVIDLMEALRQSAAATGSGGKKSAGKKPSSSKRSTKGGQAEQRKKAS